jgi:hypothetical protein
VHLGEVDDRVELLVDFLCGQSKHGAVDVDVLAPGENRVESGPKRDQRANPAGELNPSVIGLEQPIQHFQQGGFAGAIPPDQAKAFTARELE